MIWPRRAGIGIALDAGRGSRNEDESNGIERQNVPEGWSLHERNPLPKGRYHCVRSRTMKTNQTAVLKVRTSLKAGIQDSED